LKYSTQLYFNISEVVGVLSGAAGTGAADHGRRVPGCASSKEQCHALQAGKSLALLPD